VPPDPPPDWELARRRVIGGRIRDARLRANLTQMRLAERIGVDHRTVHRWEYATSVPNLSNLLLLADACGVSIVDLVRE
jgi:transcriptional regulator with XRE-family HTH domain